MIRVTCKTVVTLYHCTVNGGQVIFVGFTSFKWGSNYIPAALNYVKPDPHTTSSHHTAVYIRITDACV